MENLAHRINKLASMSDKRRMVNHLVTEVEINIKEKISEHDQDKLYTMIDFGYSEDLIMEGKCSLQASIDFCSEKWEQKMDEDIDYFFNLLKKHLTMDTKL